MADRRAWLDRAACRGADDEVFFPVSSSWAAAGEARRYCSRCPVVAECLDDALRMGEAHGIRGGLTGDERRLLRRRLRERSGARS